ncbi:hypothetical protein P153DRAFT_281061 [Dothidotthia symphoricarpi CBS 119687]|uniref:Rhodopsin domain-containing protein n=1 Tax=Dothidotthia symphoricarpi CBS 119687 TaxID=1392245 RepID=A0A6A6ASD8_9PLEO|nr:uncharacterized protein P153DRAFT_281061 [Dothidotthia symphoricarpi CBS 119687]KAF2133854.1 hypothetical protein P153DRAFT_281061 [Dothidotthia symphoricarpi CBS 119687]
MALSFSAESWIWYTFAIGIVLARLISRTLLFRSPKGLQYDDWIMGLFVTGCYTVLIITSTIQARTHTNLLAPDFDINALTPQDISEREYGSKIVIIVEQMQIAVVWSCKACLLIMYHRLTRMALHNENIAIKMLAVYVALGFVTTEILYFTAWCRPFSSYWAVPTTNSQCNALTNHRITKAVFNISSDVVILCIALTIFIRSLLPLKRKLILCAIFSLGIFVVAASIMNCYYSFKHPYRPTWVFWYIRESSTAILVANLPFTWTLLRKAFNLGAFDEDHPPPVTYHSSRTAGGRRTARVHNTHPAANRYTSGTTSRASNGRSLVDSVFTRTYPDTTTTTTTATTKSSPQSTRTDRDLCTTATHDFAPLSSTQSAPPPSTSRVMPDGTGGFHVNNRPISSPARAKLAQRPASAMSGRTSSSVDGGGRSVGGAGGGRSARDRRARTKISG